MEDGATKVTSVAEMFAGSDWEKDPLEITMLREWDEEGVHFEEMYFTGQITYGVKTRVYAFRGSPIAGTRLPGMLHGHGGGGSASLQAVKFWAQRGYVCVSYDYSGKLPGRTKFTDYGSAILGQREGKPAGPGDVKNGRWNFWFHVTAAGCRAVTLIAHHPRVNKDKIGAYGISAGGYLCWMVAAVDHRIKTIVPLYGNAAGIYRDRATAKRVPIDDPVTFDKEAFSRNPEAPELHAALIQCPVLFMTATNDGFDLDESFDTLDKIAPPAPSPRLLLTPRWVHHMEPEESRVLPIWMAWQLKGEGDPWPATPGAEFGTRCELPTIIVRPGQPENVAKVEIHYAIDNFWAKSRFWREVKNSREGDVWTGDAPFTRAGENLYAFANVTFQSGARLSSRVIEVSTAELAGVKPTLKWSALIDTMQDDSGWYWVPSYNEPLTYDEYFLPWDGPSGEKGFTLNAKDHLKSSEPESTFHFDIATQRLGDPQWRGTGKQTLLIDYWGPNPPVELRIRPVEKWYQADSREYSYSPKFEPHPEPGWVTLRLDAAMFLDKDGKTMEDWGQVQVLNLIGTANTAKPPVWANLRW